ncbi:MAG: NAD-dependent DNA ligase LigA [Clostridiales bacterium]|jgi:DNA ligase (NAD+)|nr:NAD-dependent DNA ligase LigA [Clostridiales bacterium]
MDKKQRIKELTELLNRASLAYYQQNGEIMSDREYDGLLDELSALEEETGHKEADTPTDRVGHEVVSNLEKVTHKLPMMSLDKTKSEGKLLEFLGGQEAMISWKLDGLAIELTYDNGVLSMAVTRGNGFIGENITHNARNFANIPKRIDYRKELRVRGEAVITFADFKRINEGFDEASKYKNPRNLCSGTVRQLDSAVTKARNVRFYAYSAAEEESHGLTTRSGVMDFLKNLGFETDTYEIVSADNFADTLERFKQSVQDTPYATDGLVLAYNDIVYGKSLGVTSKFPKDSLAFKWADEEAETRLIDVEWNTSRTGLINPVAVFEPVEIEGTTVERASLHNLSLFEGFALGKGDRIIVYKANMIIPQVAENMTRSGTLKRPGFCPVCGGEACQEINGDIKFLYCVNPNCAARAVQTIAHYASRDALNIEGLSEQTIIKLHELRYLKNYADLYDLANHPEIADIKGFGRVSFGNMIGAVERSKTCRLYNFIYGLGIKNVGLVYAKSLCRHYGDDLNRIIHAPAEELEMLYGFGAVLAQSLASYFANKDNLSIMNRALAHLTFIREEQEGEKRLEGKIIVVTGDLKTFKNRRELQELIEREGGKVTGSVSASTHMLINNDIFSKSSKNTKARELGVPVVTEEEFLKKIRTES